MPAWLSSLVFHIVLLFLFGFMTVAVHREDLPAIMASMTDEMGDPIEEIELSGVEIEPLDASEPDPENLLSATEMTPVDVANLGEPAAAESAFPPSFGDTPFSNSLPGNLAMPVGGGGQGDPGKGDGEGDGKKGKKGAGMASFFGTQARADRIVFLVDNSNSMSEGRFETALVELARSVDSLSIKQSFYVIFYSDAAYRMFHPQPADELINATRENKQKLRDWLSTVEMCVGGQLVDAMEIVDQLKPQVVYLLSDGVLGDYPFRFLADPRDRPYTIHSVGMTVPGDEAARKLLAIAESNRGTFQPVGIAPIAREMARRRPIKRNRTRGPVWGINLPER
jgi:hypothetical protein